MDGSTNLALWIFLLSCACAVVLLGLWLQTHRRCQACRRWMRTTFAYCPACGQEQLSEPPEEHESQVSRSRDRPRTPLILPELSPKQRRTSQALPATRQRTTEPVSGTHLVPLHCPHCNEVLAGDESRYCGQCGTRIVSLKRKH